MLKLIAAWDSLAPRLPLQAHTNDADVMLNALKIVILHATSDKASSAVSLASLLAEFASSSTPLDATAIAAGITTEAFPISGSMSPNMPTSDQMHVVEQKLGHDVLTLLTDIRKVSNLPSRIDLYDDTAAAALRELCLSFYDVRATAVEVIRRLHHLQGACYFSGHPEASSADSIETTHSTYSNDAIAHNNNSKSASASAHHCSRSAASLQVQALESLQIYAPLGHALGLSQASSQLEDLCFRILFPSSYEKTTRWLHQQADAHSSLLEQCKSLLYDSITSDPFFDELASDLVIYNRVKSPASTLKKLLCIGDTARGGRSLSEIYDVLGMRVVVIPQQSILSEEEREKAAQAACYMVERTAHMMWKPMEGRSKDYISRPKANGYQSLHSTVLCWSLDGEESMLESPGDDESHRTMPDMKKNDALVSKTKDATEDARAAMSNTTSLELQIRTQRMHDLAETGQAAHAAYKGGLDAAQTHQLQEWTRTLLGRRQLTSWGTAGGDANTLSTEIVPGGNNALSDVEMVDAQVAATEALFHSLDLNSDGRVSLDELRHALTDLRSASSVDEDATASGTAAEDSFAELLMSIADANSDGTVTLSEFLEFQKKIGMVHATSAMDQATASLLNDVVKDRIVKNVHEDGGRHSKMSTMKLTAARAASPAVFHNSSTGSHALHVWKRKNDAASHHVRDAYSMAAYRDRDGSAIQGSTTDMYDEVILASVSKSLVSPTAKDKENNNDASNGSNAAFTQSSSFSAAITSSASASSTDGSSFPPPPPPTTTEEQEQNNTSIVPPVSPSLLQKPARQDTGWPMQQAVHGFMRIFQRAGTTQLEATWQLIPSSTMVDVSCCTVDAAGLPLLPFSSSMPPPTTSADDNKRQNRSVSSSANAAPPMAIPLPRHGPCIIGAVKDKDCDVIIDIPTISGRHARLEVIRRRSQGISKCIIMDLGSTNGTFVNRTRIMPFKEVPLYTGDVVSFAEHGISFEVSISTENLDGVAAYSDGLPSTGIHSNAKKDSSASKDGRAMLASHRQGAALAAALKIAAALEADAASRGIFAPVKAAEGRDVGEKARALLAAGEYQAAYMLLLGGVMSRPEDGSLWAQLAAMERQRARRREQGSSSGTVRAFIRAAVEQFEVINIPETGVDDKTAQDNRADAVDALAVHKFSGLSRVFSSWALLEYDQRNDVSARLLFQKAIRAARNHPHGPLTGGAAKLLFTWASREHKLGDIALAARLCNEAVSIDPDNGHALTLLANINVQAKQYDTARELFARVLASHPKYVTALQCWGRMEAGIGNMRQARKLFRTALFFDPANVFVLHAWGHAEGRLGNVEPARTLLKQCTDIDPGCRAAWHTWGKIEAEHDNVEAARRLYRKVLELKPNSIETLSALGHLERMQGNYETAEEHLRAALKVDSKHAPSLQELSLVLEQGGRQAEGYLYRKRARSANAERSVAVSQVNGGRERALALKKRV